MTQRDKKLHNLLTESVLRYFSLVTSLVILCEFVASTRAKGSNVEHTGYLILLAVTKSCHSNPRSNSETNSLAADYNTP